MDMLKELNSIKPVWIELGLQTIHDETARRVNRGYDLSVFTDAYKRLKNAGITVIVHVILGLPGESKEMMLDTVRFLSELAPELDGIKLQNLQILKGTVMYQQYLDYINLQDNYLRQYQHGGSFMLSKISRPRPQKKQRIRNNQIRCFRLVKTLCTTSQNNQRDK